MEGDEGSEGDDEIVMDFGGDEDVEELVLADEDDEGLSIDFEDLEDATSDDEITLDFDEADEEVVESKDEGLPLDFGEIDISDLAPPGESMEEAVMESFNLEEESAPGIALAREDSSVVIAPVSGGLEDLQVEDLDLDVAAPLVAGSKAGDKLMPSVKTGTALDDFEIDLGELTNDDK